MNAFHDKTVDASSRRRVFSLGFPAGASVVFIRWRGGAERPITSSVIGRTASMASMLVAPILFMNISQALTDPSIVRRQRS